MSESVSGDKHMDAFISDFSALCGAYGVHILETGDDEGWDVCGQITTQSREAGLPPITMTVRLGRSLPKPSSYLMDSGLVTEMHT